MSDDKSWLRRTADRLRDATILWSFDRSGFVAHARGFDPRDLDVDLSGRVCLVTGASSGLGLAAARGLATLGAEVWLLCRNEERGRAALETLARDLGPAASRLHLGLVDLASLSSVRAFVRDFPRERIDVLVNNAGVLPAERSLTADGIELCFATNVIGPFLLTHLLLPRLAATRGRVINVSSGGMYAQRLDLDEIQRTVGPWDGVKAYALSKRAEVILTEQWAERTRGGGPAFYAMHPGWADTPGVSSSLPRFYKLMHERLRTPAQGADTIVWLAACDRIEGPRGDLGGDPHSDQHSDDAGRFFFDRAPRATHLLPGTRERAGDRERLWELCERLAGIAPRETVP